MNFRKRKKSALPAFQLTAMMDVIFLLLCFFITTSVFSQWEYEVSITLPTAKSDKIPERLPGEIILNIDVDGKITLNQQELSIDVLREKLKKISSFYPGQPIVLRADKDTKYENLMRVIDTCRQADIWNFSLATREEEKK
ncbi:MAG: biopolymer transporter ExbD [Kiritimatiellae bacterium]|nr:biopolymer transporter ExbD [Kiritimatiellia bacterium]